MRHIIRLFHQKFIQKSSPKAYFRLFFHLLTGVAKQRQEFSRFLNLLWEKKRDYEPRFFPLILSCGIKKSLPEIGHLSEQIFFAPLFLQPLHFGPSFVESWASDTEEWVCCCKISDLLLKMQNGFLARLAHSRYWSSD